jgi:hypothetical protein
MATASTKKSTTEGYPVVPETPPAPVPVEVSAPTPAKVQAALALGTTVQSDWLPCPLGLDGLDLLNRNTLTFTLATDRRVGIVEVSEKGHVLRVADCVLLYDAGHGRYLSVPLNQTVRGIVGSTLVLAEKTLRAQPGALTKALGLVTSRGAFVGATIPI